MKLNKAAGVAIALALGGVGIVASPAHASELRVTSGEDSGPGTLRDALAEADANPGEDTIVITEGLEVRPTGDVLRSSDTVRIVGEGSGATLLAANMEPYFTRDAFISVFAPLSIENLTFNFESEAILPIGIKINSTATDSLSITNSRFTGGGDITAIDFGYSRNALTVTGSTFENMANPMRLRGDHRGVAEISGNTFTGVSDLFDNRGYSGRYYNGARMSFTNNAVEFTGSGPAGAAFGGQIEQSASGPETFVIAGNSFVDNSDVGATVVTSGTALSSRTDDPPHTLLANNSFVRDAASQSTEPLLRVRLGDVERVGDSVISNTTFVGTASATALEVEGRGMGSNYDTLTLEHVTMTGGIGVSGGNQLIVRDSAIETDGIPALKLPSGGRVAGEGNVVTVETPDLATAKVAPSLLLGDLAAGGIGVSQVRVPLAGSPLIDTGSAPRATADQRGIVGGRTGNSDAGSVEVRHALLSIASAGEVKAGDDAAFMLSVLEPGDTAVDVTVTAEAGTALSEVDFTPVSKTLSFTPSETVSKTFSVSTLKAAKLDLAKFTAKAQISLGAASLETTTGEAIIRVTEDPGPVIDPPVTVKPVNPVKPSPDTKIATTGSDSGLLPWAIGAGALVLGSSLLLIMRRKARKA